MNEYPRDVAEEIEESEESAEPQAADSPVASDEDVDNQLGSQPFRVV